MSEKFYAVKSGKIPGIYRTWDECKAQVDGFPKAQYQSFKTMSEAKAYLKEAISPKAGPSAAAFPAPQPEPGCAIAYVDGSYSEGAGRFSYGIVLFIGSEEIHLYKAFRNPELLEMRNVAGEITGAAQAMKTASEQGCRKITIYHDYEGVAKWCTGAWKANKPGTMKYKAFYDDMTSRIQVEFRKVKAHSASSKGIEFKYNNLADELAKKAISEATS